MAPIHSAPHSASSETLTRRALLGGVAGAMVGTALHPRLEAAEIDPSRGQQRRAQAFHVRVEAARNQRRLPVPDHRSNGDETLFANRIASYSKGLPHNALGEVDLSAYAALIAALSSGRPEDFEQIPMGCPDPGQQRLLVNPQGGLAFDMEGADCHHLGIPMAPAFSSAEQAGELVELYWMALLRDVPFERYATDPVANAAATDLSRLSDFRGPKIGRLVRPSTLFRGFTPGDLNGPYISQFLLKPIPFGAQAIDQQMRALVPATLAPDFVTDYDEWLNIQNGCPPRGAEQFDSARRYIRNGRDLTQWAHIDVLFQGYFNAMLILLTPPGAGDPIGGGIGAPLNPGNPYNNSRTQIGFGTFGGPAIATLVAEPSTRALKAVWFQKWFVHRRLRPEALAGRVHNRLTRHLDYPIHADVLNSQALRDVFSRYGSGLLPQAYPEGSPLHPAYGAGHATVAGACVTMLKALFDERFEIPDPVVPDDDGLTLLPYNGRPLTVGGELNKLAANVAMGRNFGGIHYRSDYSASLRLGEAVAISVLRDHRLTYNEPFQGYTFTTFDGTRQTV